MGPPAEKGVKEWRLFSLGTRRLRGEPTALYNYLKGRSNKVSLGLLTQVTRDKMERNDLKLHQGKFRFRIRKYFFMGRVFKPWTRLSREVP